MSETQLDLIQKVNSVSELMLAASLSLDWQELVALEAQRKPLLEQLFKTPDSSLLFIKNLKVMIASVLDINQKIMGMSSKESFESQRQLVDMRQGRKVLAAYATNS